MRKIITFAIVGLSLVGCASCANISIGPTDEDAEATSIGLGTAIRGLANVSLKPTEAVASPPLMAAFEGDAEITTAEDWQTRRVPLLREAIQRDLYGYQPENVEIIETVSERVSDNAYGGIAVLDSVTLTVRFSFEGGPDIERDIRLAVAKPKDANGPVPVILKMDNCPFDESYQDLALPGGKSEVIVPVSLLSPEQLAEASQENYISESSYKAKVNTSCADETKGFIGGFIQPLGRYHYTPPVKEAIEQGYAFASISSIDVVIDDRRYGPAQLELLSEGHDTDTAWGSLAAWAFQYSRGIDYLETDPALDPDRMAIYGHSRFGKAVLVAGALDSRIDAVIAHQSGRGGAALFASEKGEPIEKMAAAYPQWLNSAYAARLERGETLPFDQHHVLALLAPRPVLLGHGRRDGWSDPDGAFRAAKGANPAYQLYGNDGLTADTLRDFDPASDIAYWIRRGTHGETKEDWEAFFEFLDAHFMQ